MILQIAKQVRATMEILAENTNGEWNLGGYCGIAAVEMWRELKKKNIRSVVELGHIRGGGCHCWTTLGDKIIDVTATQFEDFDNPVVITSKNDEFYQGLRNNRKRDEILKRSNLTWIISPISVAKNISEMRYMFKDWDFGPFSTDIIDELKHVKNVLRNNQKLRQKAAY